MLAKLRTMHDEVRAGLDALRAEIDRPVPDEGRLAAARLRLSRASGRRKALIECSVYPLLHDASPEDLRRIGDLRRDAAQISVDTSAHIARWTMRQILADWAGYRRVSTGHMAGMSARLTEEASILYPLLAARETGAGDDANSANPRLARAAR